jgi:hypothetical protein
MAIAPLKSNIIIPEAFIMFLANKREAQELGARTSSCGQHEHTKEFVLRGICHCLDHCFLGALKTLAWLSRHNDNCYASCDQVFLESWVKHPFWPRSLSLAKNGLRIPNFL